MKTIIFVAMLLISTLSFADSFTFSASEKYNTINCDKAETIISEFSSTTGLDFKIDSCKVTDQGLIHSTLNLSVRLENVEKCNVDKYRLGYLKWHGSVVENPIVSVSKNAGIKILGRADYNSIFPKDSLMFAIPICQ
ncbi:MAG: hypothetical protein KAQ98_03150 [Bacteriovoracaceae bacterium]|nr:hypothetical protein [Bacteriovoracaceae bacterium]